MFEFPMQISGQILECTQKDVITFFGNGPSDRQNLQGIGLVASVARGRVPDRRLETAKVQAVIDQFNPVFRRCQGRQMGTAHFGTGHQPRHLGQFLNFLPIGCRPNILGVCRAGPVQPANDRRVARNGRRRMQKMRVKMTTIFFKFVGKDNRLPKMTKPVRRRSALEIAPPRRPGRSESRAAALTEPSSDDPKRFVVQIFRQIANRRFDFVMDRVAFRIGRVTQRNDADRHTALL